MHDAVMADNKTNNIHMRLSEDEARKLDDIVVARFREGLRDRTKVVRALIDEEHQRVCERGREGHRTQPE